MRRSTWAAGLALLAAATAQAQQPATVKGLVVHEWGVFRVHEDAQMANADVRAEWDELPGFVYGHIQGRQVPQHWGAVEIRRRPIVFFHAAEPAQVRLRIDFPGGMPGVWWPATVNPAMLGNQPKPQVGSSLEWDLAIKKAPDGWRPKAAEPPAVVKGHWIDRLRKVEADEVFARYSPNPLDVERERFVYYDGLFPQGKWVQVKVEGQRVGLTSRVKHPLFDVTVVDRRVEGKVRVGRLDRLDGGQEVRAVERGDADAARFPQEASELLVKQLTAAGLFEGEARSLADLWRQDLFERPGLHLFYRLPQEEYDRKLPLTLTPAPGKLVRVGLVVQPHVEPDLAQRVARLVKQLDSDDFEVREGAEKQIRAIGPAALVQLSRLNLAELPAEARRRVEAMLKGWSAKEAFDR
jgi:hypothetical protein